MKNYKKLGSLQFFLKILTYAYKCQAVYLLPLEELAPEPIVLELELQ